MKCHICAHEIPEGKKYCPGCGRVVRFNGSANNEDTMKFADPLKEIKNPSYKRSSQSDSEYQSTINIPDIFNTDPNAPEYKDPHAYDTATAHVLEYDRMFLSRSNDRNTTNASEFYEDDRTKMFAPVSDSQQTKRIVIQQEPEYNDYYEEQHEDKEKYVERPRKKAGPKINIKVVFLLIAIIAGISVCVMGVYRIGQQFGFWEGETTQQTNQENPK